VRVTYIVQTVSLHDIGLDNVLFYGRSAEECEAFIHTIRKWSFAKGMHEVDLIAHAAASCFVETALWWHIDLDCEIKDDWRLLEQALVERFGPEPSSRQPAHAKK
jgi:hypothetical protein